jgi:hypothetical protein
MSDEERSAVESLLEQIAKNKLAMKLLTILILISIPGLPLATGWVLSHWMQDKQDARYVKIEAFNTHVADQVSQHAAINKTIDATREYTVQHGLSIQALQINFATQQETLKGISANLSDIKEKLTHKL